MSWLLWPRFAVAQRRQGRESASEVSSSGEQSFCRSMRSKASFVGISCMDDAIRSASAPQLVPMPCLSGTNDFLGSARSSVSTPETDGDDELTTADSIR